MENTKENNYSKDEVKRIIQSIYSEFTELPISNHTSANLRRIITNEVENHPIKPIMIFKELKQ